MRADEPRVSDLQMVRYCYKNRRGGAWGNV